MLRRFMIACVLSSSVVTGALAQTTKLPPDLAALPDEVKSLNWKSIDLSTLQPLEHCRAMLLMNHALDELSANVTAEADLLSAYLEKNNLGTQFANWPVPPAPSSLGYDDAVKVAVAMLRGPMSNSYYATELGDIDANAIKSYDQIYSRTCARRWGEFDESRHMVRCMTSFLGNANKLTNYDAWATAESLRREQEAQARAAANAQQQAAAKQAAAALAEKQQLELAQVKAALTNAAYQQPQQSAPQQPQGPYQTVTPAGQPAEMVNGGYVVDTPGAYYPYGGYGGYGYYGVYRPAGAAAVAGYRAGQYHANNCTWNRDAAYCGAARAQTEGRMTAFHGGGRR